MVWINQGRWRATSSFLLDYRAKRGKTHEISDELVLGLVVKIVIIITLFSLCTFSKMHFLTLLLDNIALAELLVITCVIISHYYFCFLNPTSPKIQSPKFFLQDFEFWQNCFLLLGWKWCILRDGSNWFSYLLFRANQLTYCDMTN